MLASEVSRFAWLLFRVRVTCCVVVGLGLVRVGSVGVVGLELGLGLGLGLR